MREKRTDLVEEFRTYQVDPDLLSAYLEDPSLTPATSCDGYCCRSGVYLSLPHRDLILRHADAVQACMEADRRPDPARWFERDTEEDPDFEGGVAVGTVADEQGCVFLNHRGRCVLQLASLRDASLPELKPFFCRLFPLTVVEGEVTLDDHCQGERACCSAVPGGGIPVVEACLPELRLVLDEGELGSLRSAATTGDTREAVRSAAPG